MISIVTVAAASRPVYYGELQSGFKAAYCQSRGDGRIYARSTPSRAHCCLDVRKVAGG